MSGIISEIQSATSSACQSSLWHFREESEGKVLSDKVYAVLLEKSDDGLFSVRCLYGSSNKDKASCADKFGPGPEDAARKAFDKECATRLKKKYVQGLTPDATSTSSFPLTVTCAKKLPNDLNSGFVRPSMAKAYGSVFDPEYGENGCLFEEIGGDLIYSNFVCGPLQSVKDFLVTLDEHVSANWKREWADLDEPPCILLALWEPSAQSSRFAMGASLVCGEGDDLMESFQSILKTFPDLLLVACDGNDNEPGSAATDAIRGGADTPPEGMSSSNFLMAAEAVLRFTRKDVFEEIKDNEMEGELAQAFELIRCRDDAEFFDKIANLGSAPVRNRI